MAALTKKTQEFSQKKQEEYYFDELAPTEETNQGDNDCVIDL